VYRRRDEDPDFAVEWDRAKQIGAEALEDEANRRAYDGWDEPLAEKGRLTGHVCRGGPQGSPGPQTMAYESKADIVGYGGAAGGGKTDLACGSIITRTRKRWCCAASAPS
jgi:hypothetical protein